MKCNGIAFFKKNTALPSMSDALAAAEVGLCRQYREGPRAGRSGLDVSRGCRCLLTETSRFQRDGARAASPGTVVGRQDGLRWPFPPPRTAWPPAPDSGEAASGPPLRPAARPNRDRDRDKNRGRSRGTAGRGRAARAGPADRPRQPMAGGSERYITASGCHWLRPALATPRGGHTLGAVPGSGRGRRPGAAEGSEPGLNRIH